MTGSGRVHYRISQTDGPPGWHKLGLGPKAGPEASVERNIHLRSVPSCALIPGVGMGGNPEDERRAFGAGRR